MQRSCFSANNTCFNKFWLVHYSHFAVMKFQHLIPPKMMMMMIRAKKNLFALYWILKFVYGYKMCIIMHTLKFLITIDEHQQQKSIHDIDARWKSIKQEVKSPNKMFCVAKRRKKLWFKVFIYMYLQDKPCATLNDVRVCFSVCAFSEMVYIYRVWSTA